MESQAAPKLKADRESMSKPDYLHVANPLLYPVPDKDGRYRERRISEAARWPTSAVAAAPPSAVAPAAVPGCIGERAFVPEKKRFVPLTPFAPSTFSSTNITDERKYPLPSNGAQHHP